MDDKFTKPITPYVEQLNLSLSYLTLLLKQYLQSLPAASSQIDFLGILTNPATGNVNTPSLSLFLNFNYTPTLEPYLRQLNAQAPGQYEVNYIHGELSQDTNPLIFGFGDETDDKYKQLERLQIDNVFDHIKSFNYGATLNYHHLIHFLEDEFETFILGHSLGLSDRVLLKMIFEHPKCQAIQLFYHARDGRDNYKQLYQQISRHFDDKILQRKRVVPKPLSRAIPQKGTA